MNGGDRRPVVAPGIIASTLAKSPKKSENSNPRSHNPIVGSEREVSREKKYLNMPTPFTGKRPVVKFLLSWEGEEKSLPVRCLLDTGSTSFLISDVFVEMFFVPKVKRDVPVPIFDFEGKLVPGAGQAFTHPLIFQYNDHFCKETFEVASMEDSHDIIVPYWWLAKHQPDGMFNKQATTLEFPLPACIEHCTREGCNQFLIHYDTSLLDYPWDTHDVGVIGSVKFATVSPTVEQVPVLPAEYSQYQNVFSRELADSLPPYRSFDHSIDLKPGEQPPWGPVYALSETELKALREYLDEMLETGKIRPSKSPAGAPILFVPKAHGRGLRLCVDYRGLNRVTIMNRYPLPLMNELRDRVQGATIFSKIDLKSGYNLVRIRQGDEWKTAFRTRYGHYEYLVMPFGLANAPATFQNMMNEVLRDLLDLGVVVYIDDILIYSESIEQHHHLVKEVLSRLQANGLAGSLEKCEWNQRKVEFLGYIISAEGIGMSEDKIRSILDWPTPSRLRDVQSFLGFANFYRRFIDGFSRICKPLTDGLKGSEKLWSWSTQCQLAFELLKRRFTTAPILLHFNPELPVILETDASDFAIGAVLSQLALDKRLHPVAFHSRKMDKAEVNYEIHDKEMLAIVTAFKEWRRYLEGAKHQVKVYTDHKNLEYFLTTKILNRRQARWAQELAGYDFQIIYRPGRCNSKPDILSRRSEYRPQAGDGIQVEGQATVLKPGQLITSEDNITSAAVRLRQIGKVQFEKQFLNLIRKDASLDSDWGEEMARVKEGHPSPNITIEEGLLFYKDRLWVPTAELRKMVIEADHDSKVAGHFGQDKTLELIRRNFFWPKMDEWIREWVTSCPECQRNKSPRHARFGLLQPLETPYAAWQSISMDFIIELPKSQGCTSIWVIVDRFTKMAHFIGLTSNGKKTPDLARIFLREIWRLHGLPQSIVSDRDSRFTSTFWRDLMALLGIQRKMSTAFHPETDGQTERVNQVLEHYIRCFCNFQQNDWADLLPMAEFAYNNSLAAGTQLPPFYANYGFNPRCNWPTEAVVHNPAARLYSRWIDLVHIACKEGLAETRTAMGKYFNQKRKPGPAFRIGDKVMINGKNLRVKRNVRKFAPKMYGPFPINKILENNDRAFGVEFPQEWGMHPVLHVQQLEPFRKSSIQEHEIIRPTEVMSMDEEMEVTYSDAYEVDKIMRKRTDKETGDVWYTVKWKGFPDISDWTEEPPHHLPANIRDEFDKSCKEDRLRRDGIRRSERNKGK